MKRWLMQALVVVLGGGVVSAAPLGTAFMYQGRLEVGGGPASGTYDLRFRLFDAATGGAPVGAGLTNTTPVVDGLFAVTLDFGSGAFDGQARWLEIGARTNGMALPFTLLTPRQPLAATPNALFALQAGAAGTAATAASVAANAVTGSGIQPNAITTAKIADGTVGETDLNPDLALNTFWRLEGNAGTSPGTQFIGTSDYQSLELRVNNGGFLFAQPTVNSPNLIGGSQANFTLDDADGAAIAGGGQFEEPNIAGGQFSFIGGGRSNVVHSAGIGSGVVSGRQNEIYTNVWGALIGGGDANFIDTFSDYAVIAGGANNFISYNSSKAAVLGGEYNLIGEAATGAVISGGADNWVQTNAAYATIPGGVQASALSYGQLAYGSGMFGDWGDAQTSLFVLRCTTTNAVTRELFLDGMAERMLVPADGSWMFQVMLVARSLTTGGTACFKAEGGIKDLAGNVSLVGSPGTTQVVSEIAGLPLPQIVADNAAKVLSIRATGLSGHRIRWVARVQTVELKY